MTVQLAVRQPDMQQPAVHFQQQASLSALLDVLPAGVVILDARGIIQEANPVAIEFLGEPLTGQRWSNVIFRSFAPRPDDGHEVSLRDGRRVSVETRSLSGHVGQLILLTDMTETRRLQATISRDERLASMGRMVAALAHQIRTPLTAAMLYASHLQRSSIDDDLRQSCAGKLADRLDSLERQVRDMLIFAKGDRPAAERIETGRFAEELLAGVSSLPAFVARSGARTVPANLEIANKVKKTDEQTAHSLLICNKDTLVGAVYNLVNNAAEACARMTNGKVSVTAEVVTEPGQQFLDVIVIDNGQGFSAASAASMLDAFVSTKSHGTGLGLAVVRQVVQAHGGQFSLESPGPDLGAVARIRLPLKAAARGTDSIRPISTFQRRTNTSANAFRGISS